MFESAADERVRNGGWTLVPSAVFEQRLPEPLLGHDGSAFITIRCACGHRMRQHETRVAMIPADLEVAVECVECGGPLVFAPGLFQSIFAELRDG